MKSLKKTGIGAGMVAAMLLSGCTTMNSPKASISEAPFGQLPDGTKVSLFTLRNASGAEVQIMNYGGIVTSLKVPDRNGKLDDVVLGYDTLAAYLKGHPYFGSLIGRYGNRIAKGRFELDGQTYVLATNNMVNHLHGGLKGFDKVVWAAKAKKTKDGYALILHYISKDGEEGYPGTLNVKAVYTWTDNNELRLQFSATTDKATVCNLTHHSYFNLAGAGTGEILGHEVTIAADRFTPVDDTLIPTGELKPVQGTPFDFTTSHVIGERIGAEDQQLKYGNGYDHNWVLNKTTGPNDVVARVYEPKTGRVMEVLTSEPSLQFYTGNFLDASNVGKGGIPYKFRTGFCMEPQHYPDSPNKPAFPSVVVRPGQSYRNMIIYRFSSKQ